MNLCTQVVHGLMQVKMISHFFDFKQNDSIDRMYVQTIDHCDPNDKKERIILD